MCVRSHKLTGPGFGWHTHAAECVSLTVLTAKQKHQLTRVCAGAVAAAADIMPGQGLYYTALTKSYRVKNCISNSYGVSNITYGLTPSPCRDCECVPCAPAVLLCCAFVLGCLVRDLETFQWQWCCADATDGLLSCCLCVLCPPPVWRCLDDPTGPENMVAIRGPGYPNSTRQYVKNGDAEGFASELACVTIDGYGYSGRDSQPCEVGTYNGRDSREKCKPCPYGLTTSGVGKGVSLASCGVAAGFGYSAEQNAVVPCPIGGWSGSDAVWLVATAAAGPTTASSTIPSPLSPQNNFTGFVLGVAVTEGLWTGLDCAAMLRHTHCCFLCLYSVWPHTYTNTCSLRA